MSSISEVPSSNPSSYVFFLFSLKPKWCSSVIVYQEQVHVCVLFVLWFYQNETLDRLCEDAHCARASRELITMESQMVQNSPGFHAV